MKPNDRGWRGRKDLERGWAQRPGGTLPQSSGTKAIVAEAEGLAHSRDAVLGRKERVPLPVVVALHRHARHSRTQTDLSSSPRPTPTCGLSCLPALGFSSLVNDERR